MIRQIRIQNFKALRDVTLQLEPLHVLIGQNDTGKSSILQALASACTDELPQAGAWELMWQGQRDLKIGLDITYVDEVGTIEQRREFGGKQHLQSGNWIVCEAAGLDGDPSKLIANRGEEVKAVMHRLIKGTRPVHFYQWIPRLLALPCAPDRSMAFKLDPTGFGLARLLDELLGFDREIFASIERRFIRFFPQIAAIRLLPKHGFRGGSEQFAVITSLASGEGKGLEFEFADVPQRIAANQMSEGMLLVLAYLAILHLPEKPKVLLVEEPENGVHPQRLKEVLTMLRELVEEHPGTQVVLTTHSPYVLDLFSPEEVTLCRRGKDGAIRVHRFSELELVQQRRDVFTLGEIWTGEGEDALAASTREVEKAQP